MKNMMEAITGGYTSRARVVDGTLILSLPDAVSPVVWRMDLGHVRSSALEVREKDGLHVLTLKTPREDVHEIAPFAQRGQAVRALMAVSHALEQAQGAAFRPANANATAAETAVSAPGRRGSALRWIGGIAVALVVVVVALNLIARHSLPQGSFNDPAAGGSMASSTATGGPAPDAAGTAMTADDFLRQNSTGGGN